MCKTLRTPALGKNVMEQLVSPLFSGNSSTFQGSFPFIVWDNNNLSLYPIMEILLLLRVPKDQLLPLPFLLGARVKVTDCSVAGSLLFVPLVLCSHQSYSK